MSDPTRPGDAELEAVVEAYASLIARAVRRVARADAPMILDDVRQNVLIGLWRQLQRGQTIERPASYNLATAKLSRVELETGRPDRTERSEGLAGWTGLDPRRSAPLDRFCRHHFSAAFSAARTCAIARSLTRRRVADTTRLN